MVVIIGGPGRDRTDDLFHAMEALTYTCNYMLRNVAHSSALKYM